MRDAVPDVRLPFEFPTPLRTSRLVLRTMTEADVEDIHGYQSREDAILDRERAAHRAARL